MKHPIQIKLYYPDFLKLSLITKLSMGFKGIVSNENGVDVDGDFLKSEIPLHIGDEFVLSYSPYHALLSYQSDIDKYNVFMASEREKKLSMQKDKKRLDKQRYKEKSDAFWEKHKLPFEFSLEIKEVLSGLGINSNGNGQKSNSVYHIYLHEDFDGGRFKRKTGDFLCSQVKAKYGSDWTMTRGEGDNDFIYDDIKRIPTCKKCLGILHSRFSNR